MVLQRRSWVAFPTSHRTSGYVELGVLDKLCELPEKGLSNAPQLFNRFALALAEPPGRVVPGPTPGGKPFGSLRVPFHKFLPGLNSAFSTAISISLSPEDIFAFRVEPTTIYETELPDMPSDCSSKSSFLQKVQRATRLREALFGAFREEPETTAYRLIHGEGDGLPGFLVDVYSPFLVVQVTTEEALRSAPLLEKTLQAALEPKGIVRKQRYVQEERGKVPAEVVQGEHPPPFLTTKENGIPFEVELMGGLHTGLFTDMRDERTRLRHLSGGKRVLNTFAYTGAFSVAAAVGGAKTVTTVDVVAKVLERAKRNFGLAGIDLTEHYFVRMEVLEYLSMAARRGWQFDAVVLDPPTFSSFKSGRWSVRTGYPELLSRALAVLAPEGLLWAAVNTEGLPAEHLGRFVHQAFKESGREARVLAMGGLPADYPTPAGKPQARYLKVSVLQAL